MKRRALLITGLFIILLIPASHLDAGKGMRVRKGVVNLVSSLKGLPYRYGGEDIDGFDCSGLVQYCYRCFGIMVPRVASAQKHSGRKTRYSKAKPGDIAVFRLFGRYHTAIYIGRGRFIHAPKTGDIVREVKLDDFWKKKLLYFRKIVD